MEHLKTFGDYLPGTVAVGIVLFLIKELVEIRRSRAERTRKKSAIKILLAEELEKNHWALVSMFRVLESLTEAFRKYPRATFWLHVARNGTDHFRIKEEPEDEYESGQPIPIYRTEMYEKLLPELAELDQSLFEIVRRTYDEVVELGHYRQTLVDFLAGEELAPDRELTKAFLRDFADEKTDYYSVLNEGYIALTGNKLTSWKLR